MHRIVVSARETVMMTLGLAAALSIYTPACSAAGGGRPALPAPAPPYRAPEETPAPQAPTETPPNPYVAPATESPLTAPQTETAVAAPPTEAANPTLSQNLDLATLTSGRVMPLSIKAKDLTSEWRRLTVGSAAEATLNATTITAIDIGVYYTKGKTVSVGGETYLVAYRAQNNAASPPLAPVQGSAPGFGADINPLPQLPQRRLPRDATLTLSLLNLRTSGSLNDIRPVDPAQDIERELTAAEADLASNENLRQIGIALTRYRGHHNDSLPPMRNADSVRRSMAPYPIRNISILLHPKTREPYLPNPTLADKKFKHIMRPGEMVAFYEASPGADGKRGVLFLDGTVKRVPEDKWPRIRKSARIPEPLASNVPVSETPTGVSVDY